MLSVIARWCDASERGAGPCDAAKVSAAVAGLYALNGVAPPRIAFVNSPLDAARAAARLGELSIALPLIEMVLGRLQVMSGRLGLANLARRHLGQPLGVTLGFDLAMASVDGRGYETRLRWSKEADILLHTRRTLAHAAMTDSSPMPRLSGFLRGGLAPVLAAMVEVAAVLDLPGSEAIMPYAQLAENAWFVLPLSSVCFVCARPLIRTDDGERLHGDGVPAVEWLGGAMPMWRWHGREVAAHVVQPVERLDVRRIRREPNRVWQQIMIDRYGIDRFIRGCRVDPIQEDETGALYVVRSGVTRRHVLTAVEVVNGTPEPDGSYRRYHLRVPPGTRTARAGVAWTYGLTAAEYAVAVRT